MIYTENLRGAETVLINLSNSLNELNHDITILITALILKL